MNSKWILIYDSILDKTWKAKVSASLQLHAVLESNRFSWFSYAFTGRRWNSVKLQAGSECSKYEYVSEIAIIYCIIQTILVVR